MQNEKNDKHISKLTFLTSLHSFLPKSTILYNIFILFKLIPLIVLTHDWNICYGYAISYYLNQVTLGPILSTMHPLFIISIAFGSFILTLISSVLILISMRYEINHIIKNLSINWIFWSNFLLNQQLLIIITETVFPIPSTFLLSYMMQMLFNVLMIAYLLYVSHMMLMVYFDPFYSAKTIIVNNINSIHYEWILLPFTEAIIQLEYHLPYNISIIIKAISRGLFVLYYIKWFYEQKNTFYSSHQVHYFIAFINTMCFISCLVEFIFIGSDIDNNLILLTSSIHYIMLKIAIEIILSIGIMSIIIKKDHYGIIELFNCNDDNINNNNPTMQKNQDKNYSDYNKLFYYFSNPNINRSLIVYIIRVFTKNMKEHKKSCKSFLSNKPNGCYCAQFNPCSFYDQSYKYLFVYDNLKSKVSVKKKNLKDQFPSLYNFIEHKILKDIENNQHPLKVNLYNIIMVLFNLEYDKNINKAWYYLRAFMKGKEYNKSYFLQVQANAFRNFIKRKYNEEIILNNKESYYEQFKNITEYINVENNIKKSIEGYNDFLVKCATCSMTNNEFANIIHVLLEKMSIVGQDIKKRIQCSQLNLCGQLTFYYRFFYNEMPTDNDIHFKEVNKHEELIRFQNDKQLILSISNESNSSNPNIIEVDYISHNLIQDLSYSYITEHGTKKILKDIVLSRFNDLYHTYIIKEIYEGKTTISIPFFCLITKDGLLRIYSLKGIVILLGNSLKIFNTLIYYDDQSNSNNNDKEINCSQNSIKIDQCYAIVKQNGRIIAMNEEYHKYFLYDIQMIKKIKLDIFKHILLVHPPKQEATFILRPIDVYNSIFDIHQEAILDNTNNDYMLIFQRLNRIKRKLTENPIKQRFIYNLTIINHDTLDTNNDEKNKKKQKICYLLYMSIEGENKKSLASFDPIISGKNSMILEFNNNKQLDKKPKKGKISFQFTKNKNDVIEKISLIKLQALKVLLLKYGIKGAIIDIFIEKQIDLDSHHIINHSHLNQTIMKKSLIIQSLIFLFILVILVLFTITIYIYVQSTYKEIEDIILCGLYYHVIKKQITSLDANILNLQLKANGIIPDIIDNGFPNNNSYIINGLEMILDDFISFQLISNDYYQSPESKNLENLKVIDDLIFKDYPFISMNNYLQSFETPTCLSFFFGFLHYRVASIIFQGFLRPLDFNNTNESGIKEYNKTYFNDIDSQYDNIDADEFHAEKTSVFLIENTVTNFRFPYVEILNLFSIITKEKIRNATLIILISCCINAGVMAIFLSYQLIYYKGLNEKIFAKAFINLCYLQYFGLFLLQKTMLMKDFMEIVTMESIRKVINRRIVIANSKGESEMIMKKTEEIDDEEMKYEIVPFQIYDEELNSNKEKEMQETQNVTKRKKSNEQEKNDEERTQMIRKQTTSLMEFIKKSTLKLIDVNNLKDNNQKQRKISIQKNDTFNDKKKHFLNNEHAPRNSLNNIKTKTNLKSITNTNESNDTHTINNDTIATTQTFMSQHNHSNQSETTSQATNKQYHNTLLKPNNIISIFILFLIFILYSIISNLVFYFIATFQLTLLKDYNSIQEASCIRLDAFHEILIGFTTSLLQNKQIIHQYKSNGYLIENTNTTHEIIPEMIRDFYFFNQQFTKLFSDNSLGAAFTKNTIKYNTIVQGNNFCNLTDESLINHTSTKTKGITFTLATLYQPGQFATVCHLIGNGFNEKGFENAMVSLVEHIVDAYRDFINVDEKDRDTKYIMGMIGNPLMQTYYAEAYYVLDVVYMNYNHAISEDYYKKTKVNKKSLMIYIAVIFVCLMIIGIVYVWRLTVIFMKMNNELQRIENLIHNTILF